VSAEDKLWKVTNTNSTRRGLMKNVQNQRKKAKLNWFQDPSQIEADNPKHIRGRIKKLFREKT
jgi:hypothetical protein